MCPHPAAAPKAGRFAYLRPLGSEGCVVHSPIFRSFMFQPKCAEDVNTNLFYMHVVATNKTEHVIRWGWLPPTSALVCPALAH